MVGQGTIQLDLPLIDTEGLSRLVHVGSRLGPVHWTIEVRPHARVAHSYSVVGSHYSGEVRFGHPSWPHSARAANEYVQKLMEGMEGWTVLLDTGELDDPWKL